MIQLCRPLYEEIDGEKDQMSVIFEREGSREKYLAAAKRQAELNQKGVQKKDKTQEEEKKKEKLQQELIELEAKFMKQMQMDDDSQILGQSSSQAP